LIFGLLASPAAQGLFKGAISLSGSPNMSMDAATKLAQDRHFVSDLGCDLSTTSERLTCLRALPASKIASAFPDSWYANVPDWTNSGLPLPEEGGFNFVSLIYVDGVLMPKSLQDALHSGINGDVGIIISNMQAEFDSDTVSTQEQWKKALETAFSSWNNSAEIISTIHKLYKNESTISARLAYSSFEADFLWTCGDQFLAAAAGTSKKRTASTYILYDAWMPSNDTGGVFPYHTLDIKEIDRYWDNNGQPTDHQISKVLQNMLVDFAYGKGSLPANWNWNSTSQMTNHQLPVMVFSQENAQQYPGFGIGQVLNWKVELCKELANLGIGKEYWIAN
jgi:carboxylesterase type B